MKQTLQFCLLLFVCLFLNPSCSKDEPVNNNPACNFLGKWIQHDNAGKPILDSDIEFLANGDYIGRNGNVVNKWVGPDCINISIQKNGVEIEKYVIVSLIDNVLKVLDNNHATTYYKV